MAKLTPKQRVRIAIPDATLDFYEVLRGNKRPCWFIRLGLQGHAISSIFASPALAWKAVADEYIPFDVKKAAGL